MYVAGEMQNAWARKVINRAKIPGAEVEPVIAYGSYGEFAHDQDVSIAGQPPPAGKRAAPYAMFEWEFFVPEDSGKSDAELLREAAKLASKPDFCEARQYFHGWLKQMYAGEVDTHDAREQMLKMLGDYTGMMRTSGLKTVARYAAKAARVLAPLAGLAGHSAGIGTGVLAGVAGLAVEELLPKTEMPANLRPAALLYDAERHLGKQQRIEHRATSMRKVWDRSTAEALATPARWDIVPAQKNFVPFRQPPAPIPVEDLPDGVAKGTWFSNSLAIVAGIRSQLGIRGAPERQLRIFRGERQCQES